MLRLAPFVNVKEIHLSSRVLPPEKAPPSGLSATFSPEGEKGFLCCPLPHWGEGLLLSLSMMIL
jgi:hypothetical protein